MNEFEAKESVDAVIDDLRHIMGVRPHTEWPAMAEAALAHHQPMISDHLLEWRYRRLQRAAHLTLQGLVANNVEQIRAGILDIRTMESLEDAPQPAEPEPPIDLVAKKPSAPPTHPPLPLPDESNIRNQS